MLYLLLNSSDFTACKLIRKTQTVGEDHLYLISTFYSTKGSIFSPFLGVECTVSFAITLHTCSSWLVMAGGFSSLYHLLIINFL